MTDEVLWTIRGLVDDAVQKYLQVCAPVVSFIREIFTFSFYFIAFLFEYLLNPGFVARRWTSLDS